MKQRNRLFLSVFLVLAMLLPLLQLAYAASSPVTVLDGGITFSFSNSGYWNFAKKNNTGSATVEGDNKITYTNSIGGTCVSMDYSFGIKNTSGVKAEICFDWSRSNFDTFKLEGNSDTSGTVTKILDVNESITFTPWSKCSDKQTDTLTLSNFELTPLPDYEVTINYNSNSGSVTAAGAAAADGATVTAANGSLALSATPKSGYTFLGWINPTTGAMYSSTESTTLSVTENTTVQAVFVNTTSETAWFITDGKYLTNDLTTACSKGTKIVLANNGTLSGNHTIPSGDTLLIPFDSAHTLYTTSPELVIDDAAVVTPTAFRTLTMAEGAHITVEGEMSLSGRVHAYMGGRYQNSAPTGPSGFVKMEKGSSITVKGKLYTWGYIVGSGEVIANPGSTVYECFQLRDWRGGDATSSMNNNTQGVFPVSQYYVQNIEVPFTLKSGATEKGFLATYVQRMKKTTDFTFIGSDGMFRFDDDDSTVTKQYDGKTDRLLVDVNGNMSMSSIKISIDTGIIGSVTLDSSKYVLPINSNITVSVHKGSNVTVGQDLALLPGSVIEIDEGATLTLGEGKSIFVYDQDDWGAYCVGGVKFRPVCWGDSKNYTRKDADLVDAKIIVNGYVDASAGKVYTTTGGANICSTGKGSIKLADTTDTTTYQATQTGTDISYNEISATPAKLTNAQGDPTSTGTAGTYYYDHDKWILGEHTVTSDVTNPTCTAKGYTTHTCSCGYSNVDTYEDPLPHTYVPGEYKWSEDGKSCTVTGTCACSATATATATITSAENKPATCEDMGWTTYTATFSETWATTQTMDVEDISSLGHDHNGEWMYDGSNHYKICARKDCEEVLDKAEHSGGTATCVAAKVCDICGLSYGTVDENAHTPAEAVRENIKEATCGTAGSYDSVVYCSVEGCRKELSREKKTIDATGAHTAGEAVRENIKEATCGAAGSYDSVVYCAVEKCGVEISRETVPVSATGAHNGGEATCSALAICEVCEQPYGELIPDNHKNTEIQGKKEATEFEPGYTGDTYCNDCKQTVATGTVISATHEHSYGEAWASDATGHWHVCASEQCDVKGSFAAHISSGAATEDAAEVCTVCDYVITPKQEHVHSMTKTDAQGPTCMADGNSAYWTCSGCGKYFSDAEGKTEIEKDSWVIETTGEHSYVDGECTWCGAAEVLEDKELKFYTVGISFQEYIGLQTAVHKNVASRYDEIYVEANGAELTGVALGKNLTVFDKQIIATNMTEPVTFVIYGIKDGKTYTGETVTCSVESLAMEKLAGYEASGDTAVCKVLVDMLKYGAAAQEYMYTDSYTGARFDIAGENLGTYEQYATVTDPELEKINQRTELSDMTVTEKTFGMSMQSVLEINMSFGYEMSAYEAHYTVNGKTEVIPGTEFTKLGKSTYVLRIPIGVRKVRTEYTICICEAGTNNQVSPTYVFSTEGYAREKLVAGTTVEMQTLMLAMMRYGDAVIAKYGDGNG